MHGLQTVISMRMNGVRPLSIFLIDMQYPGNPYGWAEDLVNAEVYTEEKPIESLDLRFLVGLPVTVLGKDTKRARALSMACVKAGAERVTVSAGDKNAIWTKEKGKWLSF